MNTFVVKLYDIEMMCPRGISHKLD